ncbi:MAG: hypothetical protein R2747_15810 [Pyrinomonadaceae bacterium]
MLIRYSAPNEVDISGTGEGWANWRKQLLEMLGSRGDKVTLKATEHGDPSPYDACLLSLVPILQPFILFTQIRCKILKIVQWLGKIL